MSIFETVLDESQDGSGVIYVSGERSGIKSDRLLFHSDNHFTAVPIELISLYAEEVNEAATSTLFLDNVEAYQKLPGRLRDRVDEVNIEIRTYFHHGRSDRPARTVPEAEDDEDGPISQHPAVWHHKVTGQPFLYLTELGAHHFIGMSRAESDELLEEIFKETYQRERFYEHRWRQGDFLLWNNRTVQHARGPLTANADGEGPARSIRRVAGGTIGFVEQFQFSDAALRRMEERRLTGYAR